MSPPPVQSAPAGAVFLSPDRAAARIAAGAAVVDARSPRRWRRGHIAGSGPVSWRRIRASRRLREGRLSPDSARLRSVFEAAGVSGDRPVVVIGEGPGGWGEEGRILWTLEYLGHRRVSLVDGGLPAWRAAGLPLVRGGARPAAGCFRPAPQPALRADTARVRRALHTGDATLWDTRSEREFLGTTPYGEARGGHIPGARGLHYRALTDEVGMLLPREELEGRLAAAGISPEAPVITLCSGGVRAGFAYAVLRELGYPRVALYDASMWAWSADRKLPLESGA